MSMQWSVYLYTAKEVKNLQEVRYYLLLYDLSWIVCALQINHRDKGGRKAPILHPCRMSFFLKRNSIIDQSKG